ncbi:hypothetical protein MBLNU457_3286t1 [Dothideomycetes sp. NU457]
MHEISLFGQISLGRHEQVLNILAGLAAMQPRPFYEKHTLYMPQKTTQADTQVQKVNKKPQNVQPTYTHLIETFSSADYGKTLSSLQGQKVRYVETPEPETKAFILRRVDESDATPEELQKYADPTKFSKVAEYFIEGQRLTCRDIAISLYRHLLPDTGNNGTTEGQSDVFKLDEMKLLDPSGAFIVEATVRIDDRTKPALVQTATEELNWFRSEMKGSIEMRVPERLSLDTRVR